MGLDYDEVLQKIYLMTGKDIQLGLNNILNAVKTMDLDLSSIQFFHIAGTNGKGSTASILYQLLKHHCNKNESVGLYTSPHLIRFNERIVIDDIEISDADITNISNLIFERCKNSLTFFEITTLLAFYYFKIKNVKYAVIETGLGGRLDATNIITPKVSIITGISFDHTEYLGNSLLEISKEKAGIIKENVPVVLGETADNDTIREIINSKNANPVLSCKKNIYISINDDKTFDIELPNAIKYKTLDKSLLGKHQYSNAACAIAAFCISEIKTDRPVNSDSIKAALLSTVWKGRIEKLYFKDKYLYMDVSHNPQGIEALLDFLKENHPKEQFSFALGMLKDKEIKKVVSMLKQHTNNLFLFPVNEHKRSSDKNIYLELLKNDLNGVTICNSFNEAVSLLLEQDGIKIITGSLYNYQNLQTFGLLPYKNI